MIDIRELTGARPVASAIRILSRCQPARVPAGRGLRARRASRRRPGRSSATRPAARTCRTASSSTRSSSSPSTRTAPSPSPPTAPRWARGRGRACRWCSPTRWARTGRGCGSSRRPATSRRYGNQDTDGSRVDAAPHPVDAADGRGGADDARPRRGREWQVDPARGRRRGPRGRARRPASGSASASSPPAAMALRGAAVRGARLQGRGRLPLHRQGQGPDHRPPRHHHRQGRLRRRRACGRG